MSSPNVVTPERAPAGLDQAGAIKAGELLRAAREAAGRSQSELATQLKVALDKIQALESGDWTPLHDPAFARGLLRAAAKALRVDPAPILDPLPPAFVVPQAGAGVPANLSALPQTSPRMSGISARLWRLALLLVAVALLLLVLPRSEQLGRWMAAHWKPASPVAPAGLRVAPQRQVTASVPLTVSAPASKPAASSMPVAAPAAGAASAPAPVPASQPAPIVQGQALPAASAAAAAARVLDFSTTAPSWVEVRAGGRVLFSALLAPGTQRSVALDAAALPAQVIVGNAAATVMRVDGQPLDLRPGSNSNVARVSVAAP